MITFSKAMEAVSPDVSMATTSGSGLGTGRMCFECTYVAMMRILINIQVKTIIQSQIQPQKNQSHGVDIEIVTIVNSA